MIENERQWDVNKIMNLFSYDAAAQILAVPLVVEVQEDRLVWKEEQNGEYTVRSGYRLLMQEHEERVCPEVKGDWRSLWKIRAPPKVKHLLWRICHDCLPTRKRLRQHHVQCLAECELCSEREEDAWHI
jgi:hypothetical protein